MWARQMGTRTSFSGRPFPDSDRLYNREMVDEAMLGEWWLPDQERSKAPGSLALNSRFPKLSLIGCLDSASAANASPPSEPSTYPVVFGREIVHDREVTIFGANGSVVPTFSPANPGTTQDLNIDGIILFGCHLADKSLPVVSTMVARVFSLGHWLGAGSRLGQREASAADPSRTLATLATHRPKLEAIEIRPGTTVQFFFTYSESTDYGIEGAVLSLTDDGAAQFSYDTPVTLEQAQDDVALLVRLVTFFTGSTSWVQSQIITLDRDSPQVEVWRGGRPDFKVPETSDLRQREVLHSTQIELRRVVVKWYELNRDAGRAGVNVLQAHHFKAGQYVETELLAAVTALDVLYRVLSTRREQELPIKQAAHPDAVSKADKARKMLPSELHSALKKPHATDTPLRSRLQYLLEWIGRQQFAAVIPLDKQDAWTELAKDVRNSIAHDGDFTSHLDRDGLLALQLEVRWLLKLALLKHLEVSDDLLVEATLCSEEGRSARYTSRYLPPMYGGAA